MTRPVFELSKWYLDCVTQEGQTFIAYAGTLRWKSLSLHYQSSLLNSGCDGTRTLFSMRSFRPPSTVGPALSWNSPPLQLEATWNALEPPLHATILQSDAGAIEWDCLQPRAEASVRLGKAGDIRGLGYAEQLRTTIPPWRFPLQELRWGRFLSEAHSVIWIDWRGPYCMQVVFLDGAEVHAESISEQQVLLARHAGVLEFTESRVLREGALAKTALAKIPNVQKLFPQSVLGIHERKWVSRAVLRGNSIPDAPGWAIHEVVQWP